MCISEYIFSNHFSNKPIDSYRNPNPNQRKRSFVSLVLFPHTPWPSLIPAPNQHWKRGGKKNQQQKTLWLPETHNGVIDPRTSWFNCLLYLAAGRKTKPPIKTWLVGKGGIILKAFLCFWRHSALQSLSCVAIRMRQKVRPCKLFLAKPLIQPVAQAYPQGLWGFSQENGDSSGMPL